MIIIKYKTRNQSNTMVAVETIMTWQDGIDRVAVLELNDRIGWLEHWGTGLDANNEHVDVIRDAVFFGGEKS